NSASGVNGALARDAAGNIYGTSGWTSSVLWKWSPTSGYSTLAFFDQPNGTYPISLRVNPAGGITGISQYGGAYNAGTIWTGSQSGGLRAIHHFDPQNSGEVAASGLVEDDDGNLCGVVKGLVWRYVFGQAPSAPLAALALQGNTETATSFLGTVLPNGLPTSFALRWGESPDNFPYTAQMGSVSGTVARYVEFDLQDLPQRRLFFARVTATNSQGTTTSNVISFVTPNHRPNANDDYVHSPTFELHYFDLDVLANDFDGDDALTLVSVSGAGPGLC